MDLLRPLAAMGSSAMPSRETLSTLAAEIAEMVHAGVTPMGGSAGASHASATASGKADSSRSGHDVLHPAAAPQQGAGTSCQQQEQKLSRCISQQGHCVPSSLEDAHCVVLSLFLFATLGFKPPVSTLEVRQAHV
jgi:hypothetical protein